MNKPSIVSAPVARLNYLGGISEPTEWRWSKSLADFPKAIRIRGRKYYRVADLEAFIASRQVAA